MYYGNKTAQPLINFTTTLYIPGKALFSPQFTHFLTTLHTVLTKVPPETSAQLVTLQAQPAAPLIAAGAQLQQVITVTCTGCFPDVPLIHLTFT